MARRTTRGGGRGSGGLDALAESIEDIQHNVEIVIEGKHDCIRLALVVLLAEGHLLIEDVPGVGKTMLAKAIARSIDCTVRRIQFTPDLLPSDVTGVHVLDQRQGTFVFQPGPIFANVLLVDELNRATPRTQAALLEAMEERQVTLEGTSRPLPAPFLVVATQNPVELEGTFPLPEAQLDRFLLRLQLGYPSEQEEDDLLLRFHERGPLGESGPLFAPPRLLELQEAVRAVRVETSLRGYILALVRATRGHSAVRLGASPRASLGLYRAAQALAAVRGRDYVLPDDVKRLAEPVLAHRLLLDSQARLRGRSELTVLDEVLAATPVPAD